MTREEIELQERLLPATVSHAVHSTRLYAKLYRRHPWQHVRRISQLRLLPFVDRRLIDRSGDDAVNWKQQAIAIQNTSGTTSRALFIYRSTQEWNAITELFEKLHPPTRGRSPLVMILDIPSHGTPTPVPGAASIIFTNAIASRTSAIRAVDYLGKKFRIDGRVRQITSLIGGLNQVLLLTAFISRYLSNSERKKIAIREISVTGDHLTPRLRSTLEDFWSARVINRLTASEAFGGATECETCGGFHFDPCLVPEVAIPDLSGTAKSGTGLLAITCLYPFVQMQPLIRYLVGDVVRIWRSKCPRDSYEWLGRQSDCIFDPTAPNELLLSGASLTDVCDSEPLIARRPHDLGTVIGDWDLTGYPRARSSVSKRQNRILLQISVETLVPEWAFPGAMEQMSERIRNNLLARNPLLERAVARRRFDLAVTTRPRSSVSDVHW